MGSKIGHHMPGSHAVLRHTRFVQANEHWLYAHTHSANLRTALYSIWPCAVGDDLSVDVRKPSKSSSQVAVRSIWLRVTGVCG